MEVTTQHHYPLNCPTGKWTLTATILASSMAFIDSTALNVILPSLQSEFQASATDIFWVLNSYLLMLASLIIVGGSLGDKVGRVKIFKTGIIIFIIGSVLCGFSPNILALIIFRGLQGVGGALMIPGSLSIISSVFDKKEKGKAIGTWSAATTIVTICGPILGGALADVGLWRYIFFINIPLGMIAIFILHIKVPESIDSLSSRIDWKGAIVLVAGLSLLTLGLLEIPNTGYQHWLVISGIGMGVLLLFVFIRIESSVSTPMIPPDIFRNITFSGVNLLTFFLYGALGGIMLFLSLNIIQIQHYSQLQAGLTFLPFSFTMVLLARRMGGLTDKYGARRFLVIGPFITGLGILWLALIGLTTGPSSYWTTYFPGFLVFACGMSVTVVPLTTIVMSSIDAEKAGIASGINNSITRIAGTFMNALFGVFAIYLFSNFVLDAIEPLSISKSIQSEISKQLVNLGQASLPDSHDAKLTEQVNHIFRDGFLYAYKQIGIACAIMAFVSSVIAAVMVKES